MKLTNALLTTVFLLFVATLSAQSLKPVVLEDQFEAPAELNEQTRWLIFSHDMDGNDLVKAAFAAQKIDTDQLSRRGILYVADIHRMPGIISRTMAIPAMRKYDYPIGLDREGELTAAWERKEGAVTVYELEGLKIVNVRFYETEEAFAQALKGMK